MNFILRYLCSMCALALFMWLNCTSAEAVQPQISTASWHTLVLDSQGTIFGSGDNYHGQLGNCTKINSLLPVSILGDWKRVSAGDRFSVGIKTDGTLWSWGWNYQGRLGRSVTTENPQELPGQVGSDCNWTEVVTGYGFALALKSDGTLWSWGYNACGQLGTGSTLNSPVPVQIGTGDDWKTIAAGGYHSLAIKTDGTLWTWGSNMCGELGNNSTTQVLQPERIGTETNWMSVAGGNYISFAIRTDHSRWAWGSGSVGSRGDGTTIAKQLTPKQADTHNNWMAVGVGRGLQLDGTLWTWGGNNGRIGDGTTNPKLSPYNVNNGEKFTIVNEGYEGTRTVVAKSDGSVHACGTNPYGQFGDGSTNTYLVLSPSQFNVGANNTLTVAANPLNQGSISGPGITCGSQGTDCQENFSANQQITLTATEEPGYTLHYWYDGQNYTYYTTQLPVTMDASKTITAKFAPLPGISVGIYPANSGTVKEDVPQNLRIDCPGDCEEVLDYTQQIILTAEAQPGYEFVRWAVGEVEISTNATETFTITDSMNLTAVFEPLGPFTLTVIVDPPEAGTVSLNADPTICAQGCIGVYYGDSTVGLVASANDGWVFDVWADGATLSEQTMINGNATIIEAMTSSKTRRAVFRRQVAANSGRTLAVQALNQNEYEYTDSEGNTGPGGCVPTTFAMMFLHYFNVFNGMGILLDTSPHSYNTEHIMETMAQHLNAHVQDNETGVDRAVTRKMDAYTVTFDTLSDPTRVQVEWELEYYDARILSAQQALDFIHEKIMNGEPVYVSGWLDSDTGIHSGHAMLITGYQIVDGEETLFFNDTWNNDSHSCSVTRIPSPDYPELTTNRLSWHEWADMTLVNMTLRIDGLVANPRTMNITALPAY